MLESDACFGKKDKVRGKGVVGQRGYSCNLGGQDGCLKSYLSKDLKEAIK